MSRQSGIRALAAAGLLVVVAVLGLAAKVGHDTSQYLQTVSTQRDWNSPGRGSEDVGAGAGVMTSVAHGPAGPEGTALPQPGVVASR